MLQFCDLAGSDTALRRDCPRSGNVDTGTWTRNAAERLPPEVAQASKETPSQEWWQICIDRAMPADFKHHAAKELEPLAIIYHQSPVAIALHVLSALLPWG
jgi:hypothetical protein